MSGDRDLETLERGAHRGPYADGIIDIFVGISLVWVGAAWIWLPGYAGVLAAGGILSVGVDANPGWPLLVVGVVITLTGIAMLLRYLSRNPPREAP